MKSQLFSTAAVILLSGVSGALTAEEVSLSLLCDGLMQPWI
jgi:hypothetical protein